MLQGIGGDLGMNVVVLWIDEMIVVYTRSTCTQNAETHLLYNLIMDRSHNRKIVKRQAEDLGIAKPSRHPEYLHFTD